MIRRQRIGQALRHPLRAFCIAAAFFSRRGIIRRVRLPDGHRLHLALPDYVSAVRYLTGEYEPEVEAYYRQVLRQSMTVFDIGAHIGLHAISARRLVGAQGRVVCFEPVPALFQLLEMNLRGYDNVSVLNLAVSDGAKPQLALKYFGKYHAGLSTAFEPRVPRHRVPITRRPTLVHAPATSVDQYVEATGQVPDVLKLDIEGGEWEALNGASATLRDHTPHLIMEVGDMARTDANRSRACLDYLAARGYQFRMFNPVNREIEPHQPAQQYGVGANVLCVHPER